MSLSVLRRERGPMDRWTRRDSLLAQALTTYEAMVHPGCGHPLWETLDPANEGRYVVAPPSRCHACDAMAVRAEAHAKAGAPRMQAVLFSAELRVPDESSPGQ